MRLTRLRLATAATAAGLLLLPGTAALAEQTETLDDPPADETVEDAEGRISGLVRDLIMSYLESLDLDEEQLTELGDALEGLLGDADDDSTDDVDDAEEPEETEVEDEDDDTEDVEELDEVAEADESDDAHGELVSAVAECTPSGRELFGTGLTHGQVVSAVASGRTLELPTVVDESIDFETTEEFEIQDSEDVTALCDAVEDLVEAADVDTSDAPGRPDHAGEKPEHAGGKPDNADTEGAEEPEETEVEVEDEDEGDDADEPETDEDDESDESDDEDDEDDDEDDEDDDEDDEDDEPRGNRGNGRGPR